MGDDICEKHKDWLPCKWCQIESLEKQLKQERERVEALLDIIKQVYSIIPTHADCRGSFPVTINVGPPLSYSLSIKR